MKRNATRIGSMDWMKRQFDISFAMVLGVLLAPLLAVIVVVMKIWSPGPLLFRQKRLGKGGSVFLMNKFRKFPADWGSQGPGVTLHKDGRMTGIGSFLERTKLDELPQLWNILMGEMSFVGPRPESLRFKHLFVGEFASVLNYKPGIFGPNQTKYRNESLMYPPNEDPEVFYESTLFPAKARADIAFFENTGFFSELQCIFSGVLSIFFSAIVWRKSMRSSLTLLAWDIFALVAAWTAAHWLKYSVVTHSSIAVKPAVIELFYTGLALAPAVLLVVFGLSRVYRHPARYFSETDCYRLIGACCAVWIFTAFIFGVISTSTSSLVVGAACILSSVLMIMPRAVYSRFAGVSLRKDTHNLETQKINVVVCGISQQSIELSRLLKHGYKNTNFVGFLADDQDQVGREIHGAVVVGQYSDLDIVAQRFNFQQVWISDVVAANALPIIEQWCQRNFLQCFVLAKLPGFSVMAAKSQSTESQIESGAAAPKTDRAKPKSTIPEVVA